MKHMKTVSLTIIVAFLLFMAPLSHGKEHYITGTVDISGGYNDGHAGDLYGPINPALVYFDIGDVVNFRYMFANGQKIRLDDTQDGLESSTRITAWIGGVVGFEGVYSVNNWTIDLIGATSGSGNVPTSFSGDDTQGGCCTVIGPEASFDMPDGDFLEFYGISATFTIVTLPGSLPPYNGVHTQFDADAVSVVPADIFFPEMTVGGGWSTSLSFYNTGSKSTSGMLYLRDQQGNPLTVSSSELGVGSSFPINLPAGGTMFLTIDLPNPNDPGQNAWAVVEYEGGILSGVAAYRFDSEGVVTALAGVLPAHPMQFATIPVNQDTSQDRAIAYAIANPTDDDLLVNFCFVNPDGIVIDDSVNIVLAPGEQRAKYLFELFYLPEFKGTIALKAQDSGVFVAVGLMQNQDLFTVTPVEAGIAPDVLP
jgi:hypothetical protein